VHSTGPETFVLRERGCVRVPLALFLAVWLCGWAAGEVFAARALWWMLRNGAGAQPMNWFVAAFVGLWLAGWTFGGVAAAGALLRMLAGRDEIQTGPTEWRVWRGVAGLGTERTLPVSAIRAVFVTPKGSVIAELAERDVVLTRYGTPEEKQRIAARFEGRAPENELPRRWRAVRDGDRTRIEPRGVESPGCLVLCAILAAAAVAPILRFDELPAIALVLCSLAALSFGGMVVTGAFRRQGWLAGRGSLTAWTTFFGMRRERAFDRDSLAVKHHRDSDGDDHFALVAQAEGKERTLLRKMNDDRTVLRLGRFLAAQAGWTLRGDGTARD